MHECSVSKRTAQRDLGAIRAQFQAETKDIAAERFGKQLEDIAIIRATCRRRIDIDGKGCPGYMAQLIAAGGREARLLGLDKPEKYSLVVDFQIVIPGAEEAPVEDAEDDG